VKTSVTAGARFTGRVAIVTGAAGGIGGAVARLLASEGAKVVVVDREEEGLQKIAAEVGSTTAVVADVSVEADVHAYVQRAVADHGRIDLFMNNAGIEGAFGPITDIEVEEFDRVMAINARGVFLGLQKVMRVMRDQGDGGAIVNTASMAVIRARADFSPYIASKYAVAGLTSAAAYDGAPFGIRVNAVAPGLIDTRMAHSVAALTAPHDPQGRMDAIAQQVPLRRYGTPEEVAHSVAWLLSDAASYVTGSLHATDGGFNA
jgi:NAD(P)-dependent dehydrogenase (short-subunit alcohol dehydrogenase family)